MRGHHSRMTMIGASGGVEMVASSAIWTIAGTYNFVAPSTLINYVKLWGAGGGGQSFTSQIMNTGGGAGGQYARKNNITVVKGATYTLTVGAGFSPQYPATTPGADSTFNTNTCVAKGGACGTNSAAGVGSTSGGIGDVVYAGGNGAKVGGYGGGGGSGAGDTGTGNNAGSQTGASAKANYGGAGGTGTTSNGGAGSVAGGGGAGANSTISATRNGGAGGSGRAEINFMCPRYPLADPQFADPAQWTTSSGATISGGILTVNSTFGGAGLLVDKSFKIYRGQTFKLTVVFTEITAGAVMFGLQTTTNLLYPTSAVGTWVSGNVVADTDGYLTLNTTSFVAVNLKISKLLIEVVS